MGVVVVAGRLGRALPAAVAEGEVAAEGELGGEHGSELGAGKKGERWLGGWLR